VVALAALRIGVGSLIVSGSVVGGIVCASVSDALVAGVLGASDLPQKPQKRGASLENSRVLAHEGHTSCIDSSPPTSRSVLGWLTTGPSGCNGLHSRIAGVAIILDAVAIDTTGERRGVSPTCGGTLASVGTLARRDGRTRRADAPTLASLYSTRLR